MGWRAPGSTGTPKRIRRSIAGLIAGERFPDPDSEDGAYVYDALLAARRGLSYDDVRHSAPEFMSAVRFAMFAERAVEALAEARQVQAIPVSGMEPARLREVLSAKNSAASDIATLELALYPKDE